MSRRRHVQSAFLSVALAALAAGCGGVTGVDDTGAVVPPPPTSNTGNPGPVEPGTQPAASLARVSGDSQSTLVNQTAAQRLVVRVTDEAGNAVKNVPVTWASTGTTASTVVAVAEQTDEQGLASATWQLGNVPGTQFVRAEAAGRSVVFTATATLQYQSVDAGGFHACAITPSAAVYCWGYNGDGQLGTNAVSNRNVPTPMAPPASGAAALTFRQLSGGRYHTCGITLAGVAYCWGANLDGRLGDASRTPSLKPVQASTPVAFASISSGWNHTCGLAKSGMAYCWGFNQQGEVGAYIGPPDSVSINVPRPVNAPFFKALGVGGLHSCAIDLDGAAWCWGYNGYGQLGDGTTGFGTLNRGRDSVGEHLLGTAGYEAVAVQMPVASFDTVTAGAHHSCALASGAVWCWGDNRSWQLGTSAMTRSPTPVAVALPPGVTGFAAISAGDYHTCGVTADGKAYCWGDNRWGQLGTGTTTSSPTPLPVAPSLTFRSFSAGETLSCGVTTAGTVYCVGNNAYGQIGDASNENRTTPEKGAYQP